MESTSTPRDLSVPIPWESLNEYDPEYGTLSVEDYARATYKKHLAVKNEAAATLILNEQMRGRVREMAMVIDEMLEEYEPEDVIFIGLLRGGLAFTEMLEEELKEVRLEKDPEAEQFEFAMIKVKSRKDDQTIEKSIYIDREALDELDLEGKIVITCDDLADSLWTGINFANVLTEECEVREVHAAFSCDKGIATAEERSVFKSVIAGFTLPVEYVKGFDMDSAGKDREQPEISLESGQNEKYEGTMPHTMQRLGEQAVVGIEDIVYFPAKAA